MCGALLFTSQHVASCVTAQDTQHKAGDELLLLQSHNIWDFVIVMTLIFFFFFLLIANTKVKKQEQCKPQTVTFCKPSSFFPSCDPLRAGESTRCYSLFQRLCTRHFYALPHFIHNRNKGDMNRNGTDKRLKANKIYQLKFTKCIKQEFCFVAFQIPVFVSLFHSSD